MAKADEAQFPSSRSLAALTLIGGARSSPNTTSQAKTLVVEPRDPAQRGATRGDAPAAAQNSLDTPPSSRTLAPTMALAIQVVVAAVAAGLIARSLGDEPSLLVTSTATWSSPDRPGRQPANVARARRHDRRSNCRRRNRGNRSRQRGLDRRRRVTWGVLHHSQRTRLLSGDGVLDVHRARPTLRNQGAVPRPDRGTRAVAALIGGCVAAVVALTVAPIRLSRDFRPAVLRYLDALDAALNLTSQPRGTAGRQPGPNSTAPTRPWTQRSRRPPPRPTSFHNRKAP